MTVAVAIPLVTHPLPPLSDYINHLATAHMIDAIGSDPDLDRFYRIEWQPIPNLMMDLVVPVLHRFMDIYLAGQIFTITIFAGILSGTLALNRALNGRWSALPLIAAPFLYNGVLLVGVMNYLFGIGLALWGFAAWVALRERRLAVAALRSPPCSCWRCSSATCSRSASTASSCWRSRSQRLWARRSVPLSARAIDFVATGVPFLPALLLLVTGPTWDSAGVPAYWDLAGKIEGLMLAVRIYGDWVAYALIALMGLAAVLAARRGALHVHPVGWCAARGRRRRSIWRCRACCSPPTWPISGCRSRSSSC